MFLNSWAIKIRKQRKTFILPILLTLQKIVLPYYHVHITISNSAVQITIVFPGPQEKFLTNYIFYDFQTTVRKKSYVLVTRE